MVPLAFVVLLVLSLGLRLLSPLLEALTPLLSLSWLGWGVLALGLWLLAGTGSPPPASRPPGGSTG